MATTRAAAPPADRRTAFLLRAGQVLAASLDYERTLQNVVSLAVPDLADWCTVHLRQPDGSIRAVAIGAVDAEHEALARRWHARLTPHVDDAAGIGRVVREGEPMTLLDLSPEFLRANVPPEAREIVERVRPRSVIVVPIPSPRGAVGCISLTMADSGRHFEEEDVALAHDLALRASTAIENARLHREAQEQASQATFLAEVSRRLAASLDPVRTMTELLQLAVPAVADWGILYLRRPDGSFERGGFLHSDRELQRVFEELDQRWPSGPRVVGPFARIVQERRTLVLDPMPPESVRGIFHGPEHEELVGRLGTRCAVLVPIAVHDEVVAVLALVQGASGRSFAARDVALVEDLAARAALAFDNARVHDRLARLQRVTSRLTPTLTEREVAETLVAEASTAAGACCAALLLLDGGGEALELGAAHGCADTGLAALRRMDIAGEHPAAEATRSGADLYVADREELLRRWPALCDAPPSAHAWVVLALRESGRPQGALLFGFETTRDFPEAARGFLRALADQGSQALARAKLAQATMVRQQLLESQNEAALDGIFFQDAQGRPAFFNRRLLEIFGVPEDVPRMDRIEDRLARSMDSIADPAAFVALALRMEQEPQASLRFDLRLKDGRILDSYTTPVTGPDGTRLGRAWYYRDVTEARRLQRELVDARQELAHREKLAAMGSLVSGVAHEIRTPLAYAGNHAQVLDMLAKRMEHPDAPRLRESAGAILEAVDRINRLVQDLRRFTRTHPPASAPVSAEEATLAAVRLFEATHPGRVRLEVDVREVGHIAVERVQLQQVLLNLLENAADASPSGARVQVRAWTADGRARFEVVDEGPGIPPDVQARMWEPFYTTKTEGTGLGLSIVRRIVESHAGEIACESAPGKGTRFVVTFPVAH
ncbi:MAG TPA: ATP-binding protein [Candidatus Thermoplasmatota archaeon]|nr:ATP-binding protein [Candidatus Thermoplasmatota archaeon]